MTRSGTARRPGIPGTTTRGGTIVGLEELDKSSETPVTIHLDNDEVISLRDPNLSTFTEDEFNKFWINARRHLENR